MFNYRILKKRLDKKYTSILRNFETISESSLQNLEPVITIHQFIETGRWNNVERCSRSCSLCNKNTLIDQYPYVMECQAFSLVHNKLIDEKYQTNLN